MTLIYALVGIVLIIIIVHLDGMDDDDPPSGQLVPIRIPIHPGDRR